ncbi:MAG: hypothetical protein QOE31_1426 [Solirubrobacteraceae bacterium]|nr:hypothetical protein [Solirubrobacteraceae bacterium]
MSLLGGWLLAPLALAVLCCGAGLLVERVAGLRVPGMLLPGVGLAALIVVAGICTSFDATAELAVPAVAAVAAAGIAIARPWRDPRLRAAWPWPLGLALAAFAIYAAPSLLSGQGSIAGYELLDDSATWLATVDRALDHARDVAGVAPGSYARTLDAWLAQGYPVGAFLPLGVAGRLTGQDLANAYQPVIAVIAAIAALGMAACVRPLLASRAWAAAAALVAVQASLLLGYAQWGGIKEICAVALLAPAAWLAVRGGRALPALVVVAGAIGGALGVSGAAYAAPALAVGALVALWSRPPLRRLLPAAAGLAALLAIVFVPVLTTLEFARQITSSTGGLVNAGDLGNLLRPPPLLQGAGLWPIGDLRLDPDPLFAAAVTALTCLVAAVAAVVVAARRGAWTLPALIAIGLAGSGAALVIGTPWVDAKALAIFCALPLLAAAALAAHLLRAHERADRVVGATLAVVLLAGCAWSTAAVARDVRVAPRARLSELREIGRLTAGRGPTLQLDFDVYGDRWFLRDSATDGATDLRQRHVRDAAGNDFARLASVEVDDIVPADLAPYRIVVRRRSPVASRPPAAFRRIWAGSYWEVWERAAGSVASAQRIAGGGASGEPAGPIACADIAALARGSHASRLAAVVREHPAVLAGLRGAGLRLSAPWQPTDFGVRPLSDGDASLTVSLPAAGRWRGWVRGSLRGSLELRVDGRSLGVRRHELSHGPQWLRFDAVDLAAGAHDVVLRFRRGPFWRAGRGAADAQPELGPLALTHAADEGELAVTQVAARDYRRLCRGQSLDWVEVAR